MRLISATEGNPRQDVTVNDDDMQQRLAEIGLSPRTGWYTAIALYAIASAPAIVLSLLDPGAFSPAVLWFGILAFTLSGLSVLGLKFAPDSRGASDLRLGVGLAIISLAYFSVDDARQGFVLLPLALILPPAIYHGVRPAALYTLVGCTVVAISIVNLNEPWAIGMAICTTAALAIAATSLVIAQMNTRNLAAAHRALAYSDPLTDLANTRMLHKVLDAQLPRARETGTPIALFAIDLDDFKIVNDTLGHSVGDAVLQGVARGIERVVGPRDVVARRGGDEFSILVAEPLDTDLDELAHRVHEQICIARAEICPGLTPSGSVAWVLSRPHDTVGSILERADVALHDAKSEFHAHDVPSAGPRSAVLDERTESERAAVEHAAATAAFNRRWDDEGDAATSQQSKLRSDMPVVARPIWLFAAGMQFAMVAVILAVVMFGDAENFATGGVLAAAGVLFLVAVTSLFGAQLALRRELMHVGFIVTTMATVYVIHVAGPVGAAFLDLLLIPALCAFHFFKPRIAAWYLVASIAAYAYLATVGSFPFGSARIAMFAVMSISGAAMISKVRSVTAQYIVENWEFSQRDGLTGAANVRALRSRLDDVTHRVSAGKTTLAAIAIDLDEFKKVNDVFSHSLGDETVATVARAIRDNVREDDLVARRGGDEFFVLIEHLDDEEIDDAARRIAESISRSRKRICPQLVSTASVGWTRCEAGDSADDVIRKADEVLHDSKLTFRRGQAAAAA